jgi:F420H(2)-dependent quinone reductase
MPSGIGLRILKRLGESSFWRRVGRVHTALYRLTGGRIGQATGVMPSLLLTTTGRRSGTPRTVPLTYLDDGGGWVLVASNGGADRHPAWWLNLAHDPRAHVQIGRDHLDVLARRATPDEWERLWPRLKQVNPFYANYERITDRAIPVVVLHRTTSASPEPAPVPPS